MQMWYCICLIAQKRRSFHMCVGNVQKGRGERPSAPNGLLLAGELGGGYRVAIKGRCRGIKPSIWALSSIQSPADPSIPLPHKDKGRETYGFFPQVDVTTRSGRFPTIKQSGPPSSMPVSSLASLILVSLSLTSPNSLFPPGSAICPVHRSPIRVDRLINKISGSPVATHVCSKKVSRFS